MPGKSNESAKRRNARAGAQRPPARRRARPRATERHTEIVDAAVRVIAREGLSGACLRLIAREIGYTTGVVMHHFKDREELLVAAADAVFGPYEALLEEALLIEDAFEGLRRICVIPLPTTRAKQIVPRIYVQVLANLESEPAFAQACRKRYAVLRKGLEALLAKGQRNGSFNADFEPRMQSDLLCALLDGLALHAISEPTRITPARLAVVVMQELEKLRA